MSAPRFGASSLPAKRSEDATRLTLATILLLHAEPAPEAAARSCLASAGYADIVTGANAAQAEELLASQDPDVLLLPARMPQGLELLIRLRESEQWRHLPVIMLVAADDSEAKRLALEAGATELLPTPLDASEVILRLRNALGFKAYQDRLLKRDSLTGLANRGEFMRRVQAVLASAPSDGRAERSSGLPSRSALSLQEGASAPSDGRAERSLLLLDLDRFKQINDSIGHAGGDAMLTVIAQRLSTVVTAHAGGNRRADSSGLTPWLARLDGDRFMALLPGAPGSVLQEAAVRDIVSAVSAPIHLNRREIHVSASLGIAGFPVDGETAELLMQRAELAVIQAKKRGGNAVECFSPDMQTRAVERLTLENQLRYAVRRDELRLYYQPKVDCANLRIVGVEALIRWQHPVHGLIAPQHFVALAEEAGLIDEIGLWALGEACRQGAQWLKADLPPVQVAVNLSAAQLLQPGLADYLGRLLADNDFPASRLTLELTESMLMAAGDDAARTIDALKDLGVALSLDDFGTGFSPLTYLRRLPIDEIKIDRSFVHGLPTEPESAAIAGAIIALAGALGLQVVAEGVETEAELGFLRQFSHCHFQGDLFSRPVPGVELTAMLRAMPAAAPADRTS